MNQFPEQTSALPAAEEQIKIVNEGRDYSIYTWRMDASSDAKVESLVKWFKYFKEGMVIVDAGSGTGLVAEKIAEFAHRQGVSVKIVALDISHEYYDVSSNHPVIGLAFGDAAEKNFPDNSIDIKYYATSGHEVSSFGGGPQRMREAALNSFRELKPEGQLVIRDFIKPSGTEPIFMELQMDNGIDVSGDVPTEEIDYSKLSHYALFKRFHQEFAGGNAFQYEEVTINGKHLIKLSPEWAYEFYMRKEYTGNWRNEIHEKYSYWTEDEAKAALETAGFEKVEVHPDPNDWMLKNWLVGKVGLFTQNETGELQSLDFPTTHMVAFGFKPKATELPVIDRLDDRLTPLVDYEQVLSSIEIDEDRGVITLSPWKTDENGQLIGETRTFEITNDPPLIGKKFSVYKLKDDPTKVIKVPSQQLKEDFSYPQLVSNFKALLQVSQRQHVLEQYQTPHLQISETDPDGPPYRFVIQEALPEGAVCVADLILDGTLAEKDIEDICQQVNAYEKKKQYQLDTNPFAWFRVPQPDGSTQLVYASGKVYKYHDDWEFRKIGLLQWIQPEYLKNASYFFAQLPQRTKQQAFAQQWHENKDVFGDWKKYLDPQLQPRVHSE